MQKYIPIVLFMMIVLAGCSTLDPWKADQIKAQAEADQLRVQSEQAALSQAQNRQHAEDLHQIQMLHERMEYERRAAVEQDVRAGWSTFIRWAFFCLTVVTVGAILILGRHTVGEIQRVQTGVALAIVQAADLRSRLIYLDPVTRQYPLVEYQGHGLFTLTNPNTKVTQLLDSRNEGDAQMIAGAIAVQHSGLLAMEARKSGAKDAASIALIQQPPIVDATAFDVKTLARDLLSRKVNTDE